MPRLHTTNPMLEVSSLKINSVIQRMLSITAKVFIGKHIIYTQTLNSQEIKMSLNEKLVRLNFLEQKVHKSKEVSKSTLKETIQAKWALSDRVTDEYFRILGSRDGIKVLDGKLISTKKE